MLTAIKKLAGTMVNLLLGGNMTLDVRASMVRTYVGINHMRMRISIILQPIPINFIADHA